MANIRLGVLGLIATTGCIVAPPPEYEEPQRTPPILDLYSAKPFPGAAISIDRQDGATINDRVEFRVPLRSDDQGEWLLWVLYVDRTFNELPVFRADVPPSTLDDKDRYVEATWKADATYSKGCHTLSIVIAHQSSWNRDNLVWPELLDASDAAVGTWWVNLDPGLGDPYTLVRCPNRGEVDH